MIEKILSFEKIDAGRVSVGECLLARRMLALPASLSLRTIYCRVARIIRIYCIVVWLDSFVPKRMIVWPLTSMKMRDRELRIYRLRSFCQGRSDDDRKLSVRVLEVHMEVCGARGHHGHRRLLVGRFQPGSLWRLHVPRLGQRHRIPHLPQFDIVHFHLWGIRDRVRAWDADGGEIICFYIFRNFSKKI